MQDEIDRYNEFDATAFERELAHLQVSTLEQWRHPYAKKLKNEDPLYEIRYKANKRETRALGFFGPDIGQFTITLICYHKQNVYCPKDAFKSARSRVQQIENGITHAVPLKIFGENVPPDEG